MKILTETTLTLRVLVICSSLLIYYYAGKFYAVLFLFCVFCYLYLTGLHSQLIRLHFQLIEQTQLIKHLEKRLNESSKVLWELESKLQKEDYRRMIEEMFPPDRSRNVD